MIDVDRMGPAVSLGIVTFENRISTQGYPAGQAEIAAVGTNSRIPARVLIMTISTKRKEGFPSSTVEKN